MEKEFLNLQNSNELFDFMMKNIKYGWLGNDNQLRINTIEDLKEKYMLSSVQEILDTGYGICFDQVELEREFFQRKGFNIETYAIFNNHMIHTFLTYEDNNVYVKFEHSSSKCRGIFEYSNMNDLLNAEINSFMARHNINKVNKLKLIKYSKLNEHCSIEDIKNNFTNVKENLIGIYKKI